MKQIDFDSMKLTDLQLEELRFDQTPEGKAAEKKSTKKNGGVLDGTAIQRGFDGDGSPKDNPYEKEVA